MIRKDLGVYVGIVSTGRADRVPEMAKLVGPATWFVGKGEALDYRGFGAEHVYEVDGGLCQVRNEVLRHGWGASLPTVELSDDLKRLTWTANKKPASFGEIVKRLLVQTTQHGYALAGLPPTANPLFAGNDPISFRNFIVGDFILVRPCDLWFDEAMGLKEDYDYTLQHLKQFGGVIRYNGALAEFTHRTNAGGAVAYRTAAREQEMIEYLKAKWPGCFRDNPRRPNEILMSTAAVLATRGAA